MKRCAALFHRGERGVSAVPFSDLKMTWGTAGSAGQTVELVGFKARMFFQNVSLKTGQSHQGTLDNVGRADPETSCSCEDLSFLAVSSLISGVDYAMETAR